MTAMQELLQLTPIYEAVDGGWTQARLVELPGVITAAPTQDQAQEMLVDALREFLLSFGPADRPESAGAGSLTLSITVGNTPAA